MSDTTQKMPTYREMWAGAKMVAGPFAPVAFFTLLLIRGSLRR